MATIFVRPADPAVAVFTDTSNVTRIPAAGAEVEDTVFIRRRLRDGDLVTGAPPAAVPAGKPASKGD